MNKVILSCETLEDEVRLILDKIGKDYPVIFLKAGLDNKPDLLKSLLIEEINKIKENSTIILTYGFSNGALDGIKANNHTLIAPNVEDIICLILGSPERRDELLKQQGAYFITRGWIKADNIFKNFEKSVEKYGHDKAVKLYKTMMAPYKSFLLIDTGAYELDLYKLKLAELGELLNLDTNETIGDLSWLEELLSCPTEQSPKFVIAKPGEVLHIDPLNLYRAS